MPKLSLEKPCHGLHWLQLYRLYLSAFPASERKPFSIIAKMYREGRTDVWRICLQDRMVGMATTIQGGGLVLLDYFAVDGRFRGQGIGSRALQMLLQRYAHAGLFVEIESTLESGPDLAQRLRRKQFYLRGGMLPLDVEAEVFGVNMELLGSRCKLNFEDYRGFYREHYNPWAAEHILEVTYHGERTDP